MWHYKVKPHNKPLEAQRWSRVRVVLVLDLALDGSEWSVPHPGCFTLGERPSAHFQEDTSTSLEGCGEGEML